MGRCQYYEQNYNAGGLDVSGMNWLEIGLTYGRILINKDEHFLKAGLTAKYLGGISSMYFNADNLTVRADNDSTLYLQSNQINYGHSPTDISGGINSSFRPDASTFGLDLGLVYEFRGRIDKFKFLKYDEQEGVRIAKRRDKNKYTFKVGVSLLDIGKFRFQSVRNARSFSIDDAININAINIRSIQDFDREVQDRGTYLSDSGAKYTVALPTAFSAQIDVHLYKGFYLNAMMYKPVSALNYNADVRIYTPDYYAVTPRWESRVAGISLPFVVNSKKEISAGATIRVGPLFVGTSNMLSFIEKDNIKAADIHAGLKIPIAFRKPGRSSALLRKIIADDDDDMGDYIETVMPNDSLFLKDTAGIRMQRDSVKVIRVKEAPAIQQPINIIINNYNSPNSAVPSSSQIYKLDSTNNMVPINNMPQNPATPNQQPVPDMNELIKLQQQLDSLKQKLEQKEKLLQQMEENRTELNNSGSDTDIKKKKNDTLTDKYADTILLTSNAGRQIQDSSLNTSVYGQRIQEMNAMLDVLSAKNDLLDKQLETDLFVRNLQTLKDTTQGLPVKNAVVNQPATTAANKEAMPKAILADPAHKQPIIADTARNILKETKVTDNQSSAHQLVKNEQQLTDSITFHNKYLQLLEENKRLKEQLNNMPAPVTNTNSKPEPSEPVASREDINKLTEEISSLKQEIANTGINNKPQEITIKQKPSLVPNIMPTVGIGIGGGDKTKVVHDTIYLDKPVASDTIIKYLTDTIVQTIRDTVIHHIKDTIVNTVVKDSLITTIKVVDSFKSHLLSMPPLVILFDVGKSNLKMIYQKRLDYYATQVKKVAGLKIETTGHTDKTGSASQNLILSKKRAVAVTNYLLSKGVSPRQINEMAVGEEAPIANNHTKVGQSQNRRVEVLFKETE